MFRKLGRSGLYPAMLRNFLPPLLVVFLLFSLLYLGWKRARRRGFEAIIRRKAGLLLRTTLQSDESVLGEIQLIRFGPVSSWPADPARRLAVLRRKRSRP